MAPAKTPENSKSPEKPAEKNQRKKIEWPSKEKIVGSGMLLAVLVVLLLLWHSRNIPLSPPVVTKNQPVKKKSHRQTNIVATTWNAAKDSIKKAVPTLLPSDDKDKEITDLREQVRELQEQLSAAAQTHGYSHRRPYRHAGTHYRMMPGYACSCPSFNKKLD